MSTTIPAANTEQAAIVAASFTFKPGEIMRIKAYAGGGKTTVLRQIAAANSGSRLLYVCFNAELAKEARGKFPQWVKCSTIHALAFAKFGHVFADAGKLAAGAPRAREIMGILGLDDQVQGQYLTAAMNAYLCSQDAEPGEKHLEAGGWDEDEEELESALGHLNRLWARTIDPSDKACPITHDGYLKLWSVKDPDLSAFDCIMVDEAQDLNPVTLQVVLAQRSRGCRLIFVGDSHQSIYNFRLAVNAMEEVAEIATLDFSLTESFRFGQEIADYASTLLNRYKADHVRLHGRGGRPIQGKPTHCFIARTNATLLRRALEAIQAGKKLHFAATRAEDRWSPWNAYKFQETLDLHHLARGNRSAIKTAWVAKYSSLAEVRGFAMGNAEGKGGDQELKAMLDFIEKHGAEAPRILDLICQKCTSPDLADLHLSSAHRSKGKEWHHVTLAEDFLPLDDAAKMAQAKSKSSPREFNESVNLLYVALTRAQNRVTLPSSSTRFFSTGGEQLRAAS